MIDQDDAHDFITKASEHVSKSLWGFVENRLHEKYPDAALASKNDTSLPSLIKQVAMKELANFFFENGESLASKNQSLLFALDNDFDSEGVLERAYSRSNPESFSQHGYGLAWEVFLSKSKRSPLQAATPDEMASAKKFWKKSQDRVEDRLTEAASRCRHQSSETYIFSLAYEKLTELKGKMMKIEGVAGFRFITFDCLEDEITKELQKVIRIVKQTNTPLLFIQKVPTQSQTSSGPDGQTISEPTPLSRLSFDEVRPNKMPPAQKTRSP